MADNVLTYMDGYCERAGHEGVMAEPLNAVTNLFFILAAVLAARAILKLSVSPLRSRIDLWLLAISLFAIGIGSGLFHTIPNGHTVLMDVIPITLFINIYIIVAMRRLFSLNWAKVAAFWLTYMAASIIAQKMLSPDLLNGTIMYIPTFATLVLMTVALFIQRLPEARAFVIAVLVWSASLLFRTVDMEFCEHLPIGTHFLWHTLNAFVLWHLMQVLINKAKSL